MLGMVTNVDTATGGLKDVAEALGGGIRDNSLVIIDGEAKAGKSVLSQYIAYGVLGSKQYSVAYYTIDSNIEDLIARMENISLGVQHDFATDRLRIYSLEAGSPADDARPPLRELLEHISGLPGRFRLVIVDTVSPLLARLNSTAKADFLQACKDMCQNDRSIILAVDRHVFEERMRSRVHAMSDYYLRLSSKDMVLATGQVDTRDVKVMEVTKLRGADRPGRDGIEFEIKDRVGIQILPFVRLRV